MKPVALAGLRSLAFEDFLVDLWGVVHDGEHPFPDVIPALEELSARGRRVVFVTNSSRGGPQVIETLADDFGIPRRLFHGVVSSGDVTREALVRRDPPLFAGLPARPRYYHHGAPEIVGWLFTLGLDFVDDAAAADVIVATGTFKDGDELAAAGARLSSAAARGTPLVCTNPDRVIPSRRGAILGPGVIADVYPGRTFFYGKPHAPIYAAARALLGPAARRTVAVGDLLETDIRGARGAGLPSVLVLGTGGSAGEEALGARCEAAGVEPDMVLDRFAW